MVESNGTANGGRSAPASLAALERAEVTVAGEQLSFYRGGSGPAILVLHDEWGLSGYGPFLSGLCELGEVVVPVHPGFEDAPAGREVRSVDDLALLYLAFLDSKMNGRVHLVGSSFGAWVGLLMAVKCAHHIESIGLLGPVGLRFGPPDLRNMADVFALSDDELSKALSSRRGADRLLGADRSEEAVRAFVRTREAAARYCWEPYLHTPGLERWTRHLALPVALVEGADDAFVADGYYDAFAGSFARCARAAVPGCGHFPHVEEPEATLEVLRTWLGGQGAAAGQRPNEEVGPA